MADLNETFHTLADSSTGAGESLIARDEGEAAAGQAGSIAFSFKDQSGDVILPTLDTSGAVPVTFDSGTCLSANGELAAGSGTLADVTGASITLTLTKQYTKMNIMVSCLRSALFQLVYVDDAGGTPAETVIGEAIVGSGQFSFCCTMPCGILDTTGGTGDQELKLKAMNFQQQSSLRGSLSTLESV